MARSSHSVPIRFRSRQALASVRIRTHFIANAGGLSNGTNFERQIDLSALGVEDAKFVEVTNEDTNQMYAKLARRIGLDVRRVRPVRLKKPPATKKHLALMDAELAALEDISIKFYQLGEDFIFGDMKEDELR